MLTVIIDAGHGSNTPGKRTPKLPNGKVMHEFEFNDSAATYLGGFLLEHEGVQVFYVHDRSGHTDVPLQTRTDRANEIYREQKSKGPVIYVSIHANAFGGEFNNANGIETYVYKTSLAEATQIAKNVQNHLVKDTGLSSRGVKAADFHVLRETAMSAILCECGFMTNLAEALLLVTEDYRKKCGQAIGKGIVDTFNLKKKAVQTKTAKFKVQVGAFSTRENARKFAEKVEEEGFDTYILEE